MADFEPAIAYVFANEGGYSNDRVDPGGETKYGISQRAHPEVDIANLTLAQAKEIYRKDYWEPLSLGVLGSQLVATKVLDYAVLMGPSTATKHLQNALRASGATISVDGKLGPRTLQTANTMDPVPVLCALRSEGAGYLRCIVQRRPAMHRFERGWLARAYR